MVRLIGILFIFMLLIGCKTTNKAISPKVFIEGKITFEKYTDVTEEGKKQADKIFEDIISKASIDSNQTHSKAEILAFKSMVLADMFNENKSEVLINVQKDTIWRFQKQGEMYIDYIRVEKNNGFLHFYDYPNTSIESRPYFDLFKENIDCSVEIVKKQRKRLLGYDCYKVILIPKVEKIDETIPFGDTVFEMYVTEQVELPLHALINIGKPFSFFPLEVISYSSNLKGLKEIHKVLKIEAR